MITSNEMENSEGNKIHQKGTEIRQIILEILFGDII